MAVVELARSNYLSVQALIAQDRWTVACFCANWCDVCTEFRHRFEFFSTLYSDINFLWIDIEDEAVVTNDYDVENFPTLLIQRAGRVMFFGAIEGDTSATRRLIAALCTTEAPAKGIEPNDRAHDLGLKLITHHSHLK